MKNRVLLTPRVVRERCQQRYLDALDDAIRRKREAAEAQERQDREARALAARQAAERAEGERGRARREAERVALRKRLVARVHREARDLGIPEPAAREAAEALLFPPQLRMLADLTCGWRVLWQGTARTVTTAAADEDVARIAGRFYTGK
jgi:hypothetical protein